MLRSHLLLLTITLPINCFALDDTGSPGVAVGESGLALTPSTDATSSRNWILVGTVQTLSGSPEDDTSSMLAGYRFWAEETNRAGGIRVGQDFIPVQLRVLDDENNKELRDELFNQLIEDDDVDFLVGSSASSNGQMAAVGSAYEKISIAISRDNDEGVFPFAYNLQPRVSSSTIDFLNHVGEVWGLTRVALFWTNPIPTDGVVDFSPQAECQHLKQNQNRIGIQVVFSLSIEEVDIQHGLKESLSALKPDVAVACTSTENDAVRVVQTLGLKQVLQGWNVDNPLEKTPEKPLEPTFVESETLKFLYVTGGATDASFVRRLGGWAQKVLGPQAWHHEMAFEDRYLSDSQTLSALWQSRYDLGNGAPMSAEAAMAVGAGTVLRAAIETAKSLTVEDVAQALEDLSLQTVFGWVAFDKRTHRNTLLQAPVVQWDCSALVNCSTRVAVPSWASSRAMQPYHEACPAGQIRARKGELFTVQYEPANVNVQMQPGQAFTGNEDATEGKGPETPVQTPTPIPCTPCVGGGAEAEEELEELVGAGNALQLREACAVLAEPLRLALLLDAQGDGVELLAAARLAAQEEQRALGHVRLETVEPEEGWAGGGLAAEEEAMAALREVGETERGALVWTRGVAGALADGALEEAVEGSGQQGPFLSWMGVTVSLTPPTRHQGGVLASLVQHFGWRRCHVAFSASPEGLAMLSEFEAVAAARGVEIRQRVGVESAEAQSKSVQEAARLDDCDAAIVVLLLTREEAEAVMEGMAGRRGEGVWGEVVLLGSEGASRAANAPKGMLGVRTAARAESEEGARVMGETEVGETVRLEARWTEGEYGWGTGVRDGPRGVAWWRDETGYGDRALFVYDAVKVGAKVAFNHLLAGFGGQPEPPGPEPILHGEPGVGDMPSEPEHSSMFELESIVEVQGALAKSEHVQALLALEADGATGPIRFRIHRAAGGEVLERYTGRYCVVNKVEGGERGAWQALAYLDLEGSGAMVHTRRPELGQDAWEQEAVVWGSEEAEAAPRDTCQCVVWHRMPSAGVGGCRWSASAIAVVAVGAGAVCGLVAGLVALSCRKHKDLQETLVQKRVKEVRGRLKMRKRDGFVLSSEARGLWFNLFHWADLRVIQRKQLEAVARMSLLYDFDLRAVDALAANLAHAPPCAAPEEEEERGLVAQEDRGGEVRVGRGSWRGLRVEAGPTEEVQYLALRELLLETSRVLLDPNLGELQVRDKVGRHGGGLPRQERGEVVHAEVEVLGAGQGRVSLEGSQPRASAELSAHSAGPGAGFGRTGSGGRWVRGGVEEGMERDEALPQSAEERFGFFVQQVARVQVWKDDDMSLFKALKEGAVQELMDVVHDACDALFSAMRTEPGGADLIAFSLHPSAATERQPAASRDGPQPAPASLLVSPSGAAGDADGDAGEVGAGEMGVGEEGAGAAEEEYAARRARHGAGAEALLPVEGGGARGGAAGVAEEEEEEEGRRRGGGEGAVEAGAGVRRQDDEGVRAIRLAAEDWREVDLERSASSNDSPVKDEEVYISQLYRRAVLLDDAFQLRVRKAVEEAFGARFAVHAAPVKTRARMREKLLSYARPHSPPEGSLRGRQRTSSGRGEGGQQPLAAYILDPVRATIVCDGPAEMVECARWLCRCGEAQGLPVVRIKNKFAAKDSSEYDGYRDLMMCVLFTGSHDLRIIGEIQIHDRRLFDLKVRMHKLYKVKRAIGPDTI